MSLGLGKTGVVSASDRVLTVVKPVVLGKDAEASYLVAGISRYSQDIGPATGVCDKTSVF